MAYESDQRVVQLVFDNKRFEANVSQTLDSLDKLKDSLKFEGAEKGFDNIEKATKDIDFSGMADNIDYIASRFTLWGKAVDFVKDKIVTGLFGAVSSIKSEVESMTAIGQLGGAWQQYADQVSAVQTIMAATREQFAEGVNQMEAVNAQVERLQWFTDETSYNLMDMVSNIGKFTSQSVRLDKAVTNMEGIAVWTSLSGGSIDKATTAMEVFSKSLGAGYVELRRWQQLETANLVTTEFKNTLLETAEEVGTLKKKADGLWETLDGTEVTFANLSTTLTKGKWFDSNVIDSLFTKYGAFANKLSDVYTAVNELSDGGEVTTSTLIKAVKEMKNGETEGEAFRKVLQRTGMTAEELHGYLDELASDEYDLGFRAMTAAQEAKTFREAIDSVGTAVRTSWAKSFEIIFGNYEEAKEMWTDMANYLWDVFNGSAEARNEILSLWKAAGGRDDLIHGFKNLAAAAESITQPIKDAWDAVFYPNSLKDDGEAKVDTLAKKLLKLSYYFKEITAQMTMSEEASNGLMRAFQLLFTPVKWVTTGLKWIALGLLTIIALLGQAVDKFLGFFGSLVITKQGLLDFIDSSKIAQGVIMALAVSLGIALSPLIAVGLGIYTLVNYIKQFNSMSDWWEHFKAAHPVMEQLASALHEVGQGVSALFNRYLKPLLPSLDDIKGTGSAILAFLKNIPGYFGTAGQKVAEFASKLGQMLKSLAEGKITFIEFAKNILLGLAEGLGNGLSGLKDLAIRIFTAISTAFANAAGIHSPSLVFKMFGAMIVAGLVLGIIGAAGQLNEAGQTLFDVLASKFDLSDNVKMLLSYLSTGFQKLKGILEPLNNAFKNFFNNLNAGQITVLIFAAAFLYLSKSVSTFITSVTKPFTKMSKSIAGFVDNVNGVLKGATNVMNTYAKTMKKTASADNFLKYAKAIAILAASLILLGLACSGDNWQKIAIAGGILIVLTGAILGLAAAFKKIGGTQGLIGISTAFISIGLGVAILTNSMLKLLAAIAIMVKLEASAWIFIGALGALVAIMGTFVGALILLDKHTNSIVSVSASIILFALAIRVMVNAFVKLGNGIKAMITVTDGFGNVNINLWPVVWSILGMVAAAGVLVGGLTLLSKHTTKILGSAISVFLFAKAITSILNTFVSLNKALNTSNFMQNGWKNLLSMLPLIVEVAAIMLVAAAALRIAGQATFSAGMGLLAAIAALALAIKSFKNIPEEDLNTIKSLFRSLVNAIGYLMANMQRVMVVMAILSVFNTTLKGVGKTMLSLGLTIMLIVAALKLAEFLDPEKLDTLTSMFHGMLFFLGLALLMSSKAGEAAKAIKQVRNFLIALTICLGLLSMFMNGDPWSMLAPGIALAAGLAALAGMLYAVGKITEKVKMGPIIAMLVGVGMIASSVIWLSYMDWTNVAASGAALTGSLLALALGFKMASQMTEDVKLGPIIAMVAACGVIGASLILLSKQPWENTLAAMGTMAGAMLALAVILKVVSKINSDVSEAVKALAILAVLIGELYLVGLVMQQFENMGDGAITAMASMAGSMIALSIVLKIISSINSDFLQALGSVVLLGVLIAELYALGLVLNELTTIDWNTVWSMLAPLGIVMGGLVAVLALLGLVGNLALTALFAILELAIVIGELYAVGLVLRSMADLDWNYIMTNMLAPLGIVMGGLIAVLALLGVVGFLGLTALAGILELALVIGELYLIGLVMRSMADLDWNYIMTNMLAPLGIVMGGLIAVLALLGVVGFLGLTALAGILELALVIGELYLVGLVMRSMADIDWTYIQENMLVPLALVLGGMIVAIALLGILAPLAIAALVGIGDLMLITVDLLLMGTVLDQLASLDWNAVSVAMDGVTAVINKMIGLTALLMLASITTTAGGAVLLALATDLFILGTALSQLHLDAATITDDVDNITDAVQNLGNLQVLGPQAVNTAITAIQNEFRIRIAQMQIEATAAMTMAGMYIGYGLINGMGSTNQSVGYAAQAMAGAAIQGFAETAQIHSPSEVFKWLGQMLGIGSATGAVDTADENATAGAALAVSQEAGFASQEENMYNAGAEGGGTMAEGANDQQPLMAEAGNNLGQSLWSKFKGWLQKIGKALGIIKSETDGEAGTDAISNLINNFTGGNDLGSTFENLGATIKEGIGNALGIDLDGEFDLSSMLGLDNFDDIWKDFDTGAGGAAGSLDGLGSSAGGASGSTETLTEDEIELAEAIAELKRQKDEGLITEQEFIDKVNELTIAAREDRRELNELYDAYMAGELTLDQFNEKLQDLNEKAKEAVFKHQMDELVTSFQNGEIEEYEFENRMKKLTNTMEDETVPTLEELNAKLQAGAIDAKGFAEDWEKIKEAQKEADLQNEIYQLHKRLKEGKISGQEFCDEVALLTKEEKKQYNTLKELNDEYDSGTLDELQYADGMTELYEDSENLNKSMEELLNIFGSFEELPDQVKEALEGVTDNMYNLSDTYLNEAPVLRFAQGVATQFEKAISGADATLADNVSDYAVRRTEELMLAFAKMQNAEDDDIQALENWGQATTNIITKVAGQWKDYVAAAYDAMTASVSIWSNPSWQNDEYTLFEDMTRRLDDYSLGQEDWYKAMEDLAKRGLDSEMWLDLYDEGIDGLAKVLSLAQLDDTQLAELNSKQEGIRAFAKENAEKLAAVSVMVAKDAGSDAIKSFVEGWVYDPEMEDQLEEAAEDIISTFDEALEILIDKIRNGEIVDVEQLLQTIADVMGLNSDIITNAGVTLGDQFAEGIGDGVEAMTDYAVEAVAAMAQAMIDKVMAQIRAAQASFGGSASVSISTGSALGALISTVSEAGSDILDTGSDQASSINSSFGPTTTIDQSTTTTNNVTINNNIDAKRDNLYETVVAADLTVASRLK